MAQRTFTATIRFPARVLKDRLRERSLMASNAAVTLIAVDAAAVAAEDASFRCVAAWGLCQLR